jgi:exonuclease III
MECNANGLLQHQHEFQVILCTENIDICLIAETHFTKESFIRFQNYTTYQAIHPANTARGGSAIIIKKQYSTL